MFTRNLNGKVKKVHNAEKVEEIDHKNEDKDKGGRSQTPGSQSK